jgi:hypothetical protein
MTKKHDLKQRIADLEVQVEELKRLLNLADQQIEILRQPTYGTIPYPKPSGPIVPYYIVPDGVWPYRPFGPLTGDPFPNANYQTWCTTETMKR